MLKKKNSFRKKIIFHTLVVYVIAFGVVTYFLSNAYEHNLENTVFVYEREKAANIAENINQLVMGNLEKIQNLSVMAEGVFTSKLTPHMVDFLNALPDIQTVKVWDANGKIIDNLTRENLLLLRSPLDENAKFNEAAFKIAMHRHSYIGPVEFSRGGLPFITMAYPLLNRNQVVAVIACKFSLLDAWRQVAKVNLGITGTAFVFDNSGNMIIGPDNTEITAVQNFRIYPEVSAVLQNDLINTNKLWKHKNQAKSIVAVAVPIKHLGWGVMVQQDESEAFAQYYKLLIRIIAITLLVLIASGVLLSYLVRKFTLPLDVLKQGTSVIGQGNFLFRFQIDSDDELQALGEAFNEMAISLAKRDDEISRQNEALKELDRLKTDFFSNISHELRTPLTLILGPLSQTLAHSATMTKDEITVLLQVVNRNAKRLLRLVNNLLDFSKIEADKMEVRLSKMDLNQFLNDIVASAELYAKQKNVNLLTFLPEKTLLAMIDEEKVERVILNLISNAMKFTPAGGQISVTLHAQDDKILIKVTDTGIGIPKEEIEHIFERFRQVDNSLTRSFEGSGLGLAISYSLAKILNGDLTVESHQKQGSIFTLALPYVYAQETTYENTMYDRYRNSENLKQAVAVEMADNIDGAEVVLGQEEDCSCGETNQKRILVVEDNSDMLFFLHDILSTHFSAVCIHNVSDAMLALEREDFDIVLTDVMIPDLSGYDLLHFIRSHEKLKYLPVIFLTARSEVAMRVEGLEHGADDYIVKPFQTEELLARIRAQLRIKKIKDDLAQDNNELRKLTYTDDMTGLYNRRFLEYLISELSNNHDALKFPISLIMVDLNDLKKVNDTLGHLTGDIYIKTVANTLLHCCREKDFVIRYGGDEMLLLLSETPNSIISTIINRINDKILEWNISHSSENLKLEISLGTATALEFAHFDIYKLIAEADDKMYQQKKELKGF